MKLEFEQLMHKCQQQFEEIVAIRRDLHMHPETGFDVHRTAGIVSAELKKLGLRVQTGVGQSGVIADLIVPGAQRRIALRADMDALPMQEMGNPPYKSTVPGKAHMCGHDGHTAMLIGAARVIVAQKAQLQAHVRFIFQPNEENFPGGAPAMIADGALADVDEIYGLHVWPYHPTGHYGICEGPALAQPDVFEIKIQGRGGHAAIPHKAIDPIVIGCQVVNALQTIVARNVDPLDAAVVTVTQFHAGTTHNVIPEEVALVGTVRTYKKDVQQFVRQQIDRILAGITSSYGASYHLEYEEGYPVTFNHAAAAAFAREVSGEIQGSEYVHYPDTPVMGGEDFSYYTEQIPGCFVFLGIRNEEKGIIHSVHDPHFDLDEDALVYGMALHAGLALNFK